eukprot:366681_1
MAPPCIRSLRSHRLIHQWWVTIMKMIISYVTLAHFATQTTDGKERQMRCMDTQTGAVTLLLLIGTLWPDFVSTSSLIIDFVNDKGFIDQNEFLGSIVIVIELLMALGCGVYVGMHAESEFDSVNCAVGILFVHDLDEKIFQSMYVLRSKWKRWGALAMWIVGSVLFTMPTACWNNVKIDL